MSRREVSRLGEMGDRTRGFSLLEVMVALVIISIGLLGVAKMQALAYASTSTASSRSLAAIEAASLGSAMRANRAYWAVGAAPVTITITGTVISDATLAATATAANFCTPAGSAPCTPAQLAAFDLHRWATALNALLPNPTATISCPTVVTPINCTIQVNWAEKMVAINDQGAGGPAMQAPTYLLYVEP
jgi:type IV pilus assembly protein PilV